MELGVGCGVDTELVAEVPKKLVDMIPSAEMVNFAVHRNKGCHAGHSYG